MALPEVVEVNGVTFLHYFDDLFEGYRHYDGAARMWYVNRGLAKDHNHPWVAYCHEQGEGERELNAATVSGGTLEHKNPLYHLDALNPLSVLVGMVRLIKEANTDDTGVYRKPPPVEEWPERLVEEDDGEDV